MSDSYESVLFSESKPIKESILNCKLLIACLWLHNTPKNTVMLFLRFLRQFFVLFQLALNYKLKPFARII